MSAIFTNYLQRNRSVGQPLSQIRPADAAIYQAVRPAIKGVSSRASLPSANLYDAVGDVALALRTTPVAISSFVGASWDNGGASLVGLTSLLYGMIGIGRARDSYRQMQDCQRIGDATGARLAGAQIAENSFVVGGSVALLAVRTFSAVQTFFQLIKEPLVLSGALVMLQSVATWLSVALYTVFYLIFSGRQVAGLVGLSNGNALREKLLSSSDPVQELREIIDEEMYRSSDFTADECTEMALQEGATWLEKLEKKVKDFPWEPTDESRRAHVCRLFLDHPEYLMAEMGMPIGFEKMSPEGRLIRFGSYVGEKRLAAALVNELKRQLGTEAVEVFNQENPDRAAFEKALKSAHWSEWGVRWKMVLKLGLAVVSAAAMILGTLATGGLAVAIPLLILGVAGLVWIFLADGKAFLSQWFTGEVRKWDKFLVGFSVALSLISLGVLIAFTVLSGGAPLYIAGLIFAIGWLIINIYSGRMLIDSQNNPWKYQKQISIETYQRFLKTKHSEEERVQVWNKLSKADQEFITEHGIESWERLKEESHQTLMAHLKEASRIVQKMASH